MNKLFHGLLALVWVSGMCTQACLAQQFDSPFTTTQTQNGGNSGITGKQTTTAPPAKMGLLAPNSVNTAPIEGAGRTFGFPGGGSKPYRGVSNGVPSGASLPATSTSSLQNLSITDDEKGCSDGGPIYGNLGGGQ